MSYRVGIVGAGLIGTKRAKGLPPTLELVSVYDTDTVKAHRIAQSAGARVEVADSIDDITSKQLDLIIVATTHRSLPEVALRALQNGSHVLIEKPGANTLEPLIELREIANSANLRVLVGFNHRFHPSFLRAKEVIDSGEYGKLLWIRARYGHGGRLGYEKEWRANKWQSGGGELLDQGSHLIDLTRMLVGDVDLAFGEIQTSFWKMDVEDNAFVALRPRCGGFVWLHASWTEWKNTFSFEITLERAKIEISGLGGSYGQEQMTLFRMQPEMGPPPSDVWTWAQTDSSWHDELQAVTRAVEGTPSLVATIDDAIAVHEIIKKVYES